MNAILLIDKLGKSNLPPGISRLLKRGGIHIRYVIDTRACHEGFRKFGSEYSNRILFIAGLPKSGTTWLKKMLTFFAGFHELLIPDATSYELSTGGSHDYELPGDIFSRFSNMLVVTKMHVHGSPHNVDLLQEARIKYVVLYRDLRDIAVSYYYYVRQTSWHPEYSIYSQLSLENGLLEFSKRLLPEYVEWIRSWHENRDPEMSLEIKYEELLSNPFSEFSKITEFWNLDSNPQTIERTVAENSFNKLSGGRKSGQDDASSFFRKGIAGDWKNHFTSEISDHYKQMIGDFLIEFGYESDLSW